MRILCIFFCLCLLSACIKTELDAVEVLKVFDGDSFLVKDYPCIDCNEYQVRLLGIDAPESKQKPWGPNSKSVLEKLIGEDMIIFLEYDIQKIDKYKRHLAYAFADKDKEVLINEKMISSGSAELYSFTKDLKYLGRLKNAEISAKASGLGIWDKNNPLTQSPSVYRKKHKSKTKS
jgi:micrococcal nuclease